MRKIFNWSPGKWLQMFSYVFGRDKEFAYYRKILPIFRIIYFVLCQVYYLMEKANFWSRTFILLKFSFAMRV